MSSTSRSRVRVFSALFALVAMIASFVSSGVPASAAVPAHAHPKPPVAKSKVPGVPEFWFGGVKVIFQHSQTRQGEMAVATDDLGFGLLLTKTGCTLSYDPAQKYLVIATADHRNISFTIGDPHYMVGDVGEVGPFAPYTSNGAAYIPFSSLISALHIALVTSLNQTILQPQLAAIDVDTTSLATIVTLHSATPLRFKRISEDGDDKLTLALLGVGSSLPVDRPVSGVGLNGISIASGGTPRNPTVVLSFDNASGGSYVLAPPKSANDLVLAFAPQGTSLGGTVIPPSGNARDAETPLLVRASHTNVPPAPPTPVELSPATEASPTPADDDGNDSASGNGVMAPIPPVPDASAPAADVTSPAPLPAPAVTPASNVQVSSVDYSAEGLGLTVAVGLTGGPVPYEFHRLPDNRWYVDLRGVSLGAPPRDEPVDSDAVTAIRVKQLEADGAPVVRIALTLATPRVVNLRATPGGFAIAVDSLDDLSPQIAGAGTLGASGITTGPPTSTALVPPSGDTPDGAAPPWKFGSDNGGGRLIVIDPGHGGSDDGASHNGLKEKDLTLDMSRRLRTILEAHGWQVKMTRDSDVDVFGPNASAHDELQARCDVANNAGAHLFISIHVNSFTSSDLNGTTTYYFTGQSLALAQAVHHRLINAGLETKDDGIIKNNFYVIHHTTMPAILVETAFVSNSDDAELLRSPAWRQKLAAGIAAGVGEYDAANPTNAAMSGDTNSDGP